MSWSSMPGARIRVCVSRCAPAHRSPAVSHVASSCDVHAAGLPLCRRAGEGGGEKVAPPHVPLRSGDGDGGDAEVGCTLTTGELSRLSL